jgi:hypothetical protein
VPKARVEGIPQINAGQGLYGELPIELLPAGDAADQLSAGIQIAVWDGVQWHISRLVGGGGLDINYSASENTVELYFGSNRTYGLFWSDAILLVTDANTFTADSVLV